MRRDFILVLAVVLLASSCNAVAEKVVSKVAKEVAEEVTEKGAKKALREAAESGSKKAAKEAAETGLEKTAREMAEQGAGRSLRELASSSTIYRQLYDSFSQYISKDFAEDVSVEGIENGTRVFSKTFPNSSAVIRGNVIEARAGSLVNSGPVNEFLNHLLPNSVYKVDGCFVYKTDKFGRVIEAVGDRSNAIKTIERNTQRNSDVQKLVINTLDGTPGLHEGGHLFACSTGGPNELINQVPMVKELNQHGLWRQLEIIEEKALKEGRQVKSIRKPLYRGDSKLPYAIEFTSIIDGKKTTTIVKNL